MRANAQQPKLFFGVTLILIFAEAIGLYGKWNIFRRDLGLVILAARKHAADTDAYFMSAFFLLQA